MALIEELEDQGNFLFKYRSYFPIIFFAFAVLAFYQESKSGNELLTNQTYWLVSLGVGLAGLLVRILTVGFTPKNTSGRNTGAGQVADELNTTGIYSLVRHPLYVGNFLMWLSPAMLCANLWFIASFTLLYWVYYERIMFAEEAFLRKKFGSKYLDWAKGVPAFIIKLASPTQAKYPFSIKKVLKKEKNGVFALFTLFFVFDYLQKGFSDSDWSLVQNNWFWAFVVSGVVYFILKFIKRGTQWLEDGRG